MPFSLEHQIIPQFMQSGQMMKFCALKHETDLICFAFSTNDNSILILRQIIKALCALL